MSVAASLESAKTPREAIAAYGPIQVLVPAGALAGLVPYVPLRVAQQIWGAIAEELATDAPAAAAVVPVYAFILVGLLLTLLFRAHRRQSSSQFWWRIRWERLVGIPAFAWLAWLMMMRPDSGATAGELAAWILVGGAAISWWWRVYWWWLGFVARSLWGETAEATVWHLRRHMGLSHSQVSWVRVDSSAKRLSVGGTLSVGDAQRLHMGLLLALPRVDQVEISSSLFDRSIGDAELSMSTSAAKRVFEGALARRARREQVVQMPEPVVPPWSGGVRPRPAWQRAIAAAVGVALVWVLWSLGLLSPINPAALERDIQSFFRSGSARTDSGRGGRP